MSELLRVADLRVELPVHDGTRAVHDGTRAVLDGVSLSVDAGEAVGLVGESGSGKTMTARSLLRLLPVGARASGDVRFDGAAVLGLSGEGLLRYRAGGVAMIHQDPRAHVNPVRRVGDFLTEALVLVFGVAREEAERRMVRLLGETGIAGPERRMRQYPHELSGGLLQRVMIAAALACDPKLLIADEPTTALDVTTQSEVMALIDELRRARGLALLFITHNLDLAASVCDRIAVMYRGTIVEDRPSHELSAGPRHPYTAKLLAARPTLSGLAGGWPAQSPVGAPTPPEGGSSAATAQPPAARTAADGGPPGGGGAPFGGGGASLGGDGAPVLSVDGLGKTFHGAGRSRRRDGGLPDGGLPDGGLPDGGLPDGGLPGGGLRAVHDVSFTVGPGRSLAIVGESGSGKTTIARMIVGLDAPTAGAIVVAGRPRDSPPRRARERRRRGGEAQIVFQDPYASLNPHQRVGVALAEVLALHFRLDRAARARRVAQLLADVGLDPEHASALPRSLSGGQRQRVAIARALAVQPRLLILDEAVSSLDVSTQAQILDLLAELRARTGASYLFISHDLAVVRRVSDEVIVMRQGVVVERGLTAEVLSAPQHPYTRLLLDCVPRPGWRPRRVSALTSSASAQS